MRISSSSCSGRVRSISTPNSWWPDAAIICRRERAWGYLQAPARDRQGRYGDSKDSRGWTPLFYAAENRRAAIVASINLAPFFVGGRTNPIATKFGVSYISYYIAHHWMGRVAAAEAFIHGVVILSQNPERDAIFISRMHCMFRCLGYGSELMMIDFRLSPVIVILSQAHIRQALPWELFLATHIILYLTATGALAWHVMLIHRDSILKFLALIPSLVWLLSHVYRMRRRIPATVTSNESLLCSR